MQITKLEVESFRGIIGRLTLELGQAVNGRPPVLLLNGDNGSGKSSIADAFEFGLQGRLHRRKGFSQPEVPLLLPVGAKSGHICLHLDSGQVLKREIRTDAFSNAIQLTPNKPFDGFGIAPLVLRRADILSFWDTPEHQRQAIFADVILASHGDKQLDNLNRERYDTLERKQANLKGERQRFVETLAIELKLSRLEIPLELVDFAVFVKKHLYAGQTKEEREKARKAGKTVNCPSVQAIQSAKRIEEITRELLNVKALLKSVLNSAPTARLYAVRDLLLSAEGELTRAFKLISPSGDYISRLKIITGTVGRVDLDIEALTADGYEISPRRVFSEANRDLLAFLVFLTIIHEAGQRGQNKILVLDDVFQSVDAGIRLRVAEYVFENFADWQLVITTHDRLWHHQLRALTKRFNRPLADHSVLRWEPSVGPVIIGATINAEERLQKALETGDSVGCCAHGGLLLELLCQELTVNLATSVTRRPGDQYTLGDMWPSLFSVLKKTHLKPEAENVERWSLLRNLVGAH